MVYSGFSTTDEVPVILHLDSLKLQNSSVIAENLRMFFSYQWQRQFFDSFKFTKINYPVICPKGKFLCYLPHFNVVLYITFFLCFVVPSQLNGYDCSLFVCCYAAGLHKIRHELFTYTVIYSLTSPLLEKVTQNYNFQFDQQSVSKFRIQLGTLVDNFSCVYNFGTLPTTQRGKDAEKKQRAAKSNPKKKSNASKHCGKWKAIIEF
jgi:hypothetical protein